jgi:hypothetical protein
MAVQVVTAGGVLSSPASAFSANAQASCTIMAWIRFDAAGAWSTRTSVVGVYGPASPTTAMQMGVIAVNTFGVWTWGGGTLVNAVAHGQPVGVWNHYAMVYTPGTATLYINGVLNATQASTQLAGNLSQMFINGYPTGGTSESGNTSVDDVIFLSRAATVDEIVTIVNASGTRDGIFSGVEARYAYEEGPIATSVVSGVNLTLANATMTSSGGTAPIYVPSRVMTNLRQVQG